MNILGNKTEAGKTTEKIPRVVHETRDYSLFKSISGNRAVNNLHKNKIKKSMEMKYLYSPIIVNENYQIIDGQHRFECVKELGFMLYYIICPGYQLREVQLLNAISKRWSPEDFEEAYCQMESKNYIDFREWRKRYNLSSINVARNIWVFCSTDQSIVQMFKEGHLPEKSSDSDRLALFLDNMERAGFGFVKINQFVCSIISVFKKPGFSIDELERKILDNRAMFYQCAKATQYVELIEKIYNYHKRDKISLKYS